MDDHQYNTEEQSYILCIKGSACRRVEDVKCETVGEESEMEPDSTENAIDNFSNLCTGANSPHSYAHLISESSSNSGPLNPALLKPFGSGWRREMVWRNPNGDNKRRVDVYYYTPSGKKLRSMKIIAKHLDGTDLTLENFSFCKVPVGIDDPEKETIRNAKRSYPEDDTRMSKPLKLSRRSFVDFSGTPRVVFKNGIQEPVDSAPCSQNNIDDETCRWLPPTWGKLLSILRRQ